MAKPRRTAPRLSSCARAADAVLRELSQATTVGQLESIVDAICRDLGFRHFALIHHDDLNSDECGKVKIIKYPSAVERRIICEGGWRRDPVIRACFFSPCAFRWSELPSIVEMGRHEYRCLELGAASGLDDGITVPFQLLGDCLGSCTFAGTSRVPRASDVLGIAQMVGVFAFQAARRIMSSPRSAPAGRPKLHPRPRDCVVLSGRGMSNKEIARALSLTPRTVDGYLTEARQTFDVHDRTELVLRALFAGEVGAQEINGGQPE